MRACVRAGVHPCVSVCICVCAHEHSWMCVCLCVCMFVNVHMHSCVCVNVCTRVCVSMLMSELHFVWCASACWMSAHWSSWSIGVQEAVELKGGNSFMGQCRQEQSERMECCTWWQCLFISGRQLVLAQDLPTCTVYMFPTLGYCTSSPSNVPASKFMKVPHNFRFLKGRLWSDFYVLASRVRKCEVCVSYP